MDHEAWPNEDLSRFRVYYGELILSKQISLSPRVLLYAFPPFYCRDALHSVCLEVLKLCRICSLLLLGLYVQYQRLKKTENMARATQASSFTGCVAIAQLTGCV